MYRSSCDNAKRRLKTSFNEFMIIYERNKEYVYEFNKTINMPQKKRPQNWF